jgi:phosphoserine phosphatase
MHPHSVLVTVTGYDRPGVTSALFSALAAHDVEVLDVEQVVIRDRLVLGAVLAVHGEPGPLRRAVTHAAEALGTEVEVTVTEDFDDVPADVLPRHHVLILGRPLRAGAVGEMTRPPQAPMWRWSAPHCSGGRSGCCCSTCTPPSPPRLRTTRSRRSPTR